MRFRFGDLVVDSARLTVERDGVSVGVQPQVFDVLCYLVEHRDRVVPKTELLDQVWGDRFVSESALSSRIKSVRQLVGDDGVRQSVVKTAHGRGFRWVADIDVLEPDPPETSGPESERPAISPPPVRPKPPPGPHTETLGRDEIIAQVIASVDSHRMITLIGPPGIGKTRVALEVLRHVDRAGRDASFVELHTASSRDDIVRLVRQGVGLDRHAPASMDPSEDDLERWLLERLAGTRILLVLDNCEHVARQVASFASSLLSAAPAATILATSRRTLWVDGEHLVVVRPLDQPDDEPSWDDVCSSAAGRLFVERSTAAGATWSGLDEEARVVNGVCRRLDGVPLAIELAAARMRWMSIERLLIDLAASVDRGTRGDPLTGSLRASRALLDEPAQAAFDALSIFAGTFPLDAALAVISAVRPGDAPLAVFQQLVDHSLIDVVDRSTGRYRLLAPVRQFAAAGDPRPEIAGRALLAFYAELVESTWPPGSIARADGWEALDADVSDMINLLERAAPFDAAGARRLVGSMGPYWWNGDAPKRCVAICEQLGEPTDDDPAAAARYLLTWSMCSSLLWQPMPERARRAHRLALDTGQWSVAATALSLTVAGDHVWADLDEVRPVWDEIESLYRRAGDVAGEAWARVDVLGHAQACAGRSAEAVSSLRTAIELYRRIGDRIGVATAAVRLAREAIWIGSDVDLAEEALALVPDDLGQSPARSASAPPGLLSEASWYAARVAEARGDTEKALEGHRRALAISEADAPGTIVTNTMRVHLAGALRRAGRFPEAVTCLRDAVATVLRSTGRNRWAHSTWVLETLAGLLAEMGRHEDAATLFGAAEAGREHLDAAMPTWDRPGYERDVASLGRSPAVSTAWDEGGRLDLEQACRLALSVCDGIRFGDEPGTSDTGRTLGAPSAP